MNPYQLLSAKEWSKTTCPESKEEYIAEAIKLITAGYKSNPQSTCLDQAQFKYFDLSLTDVSDKPDPKPIMVKDDFKYTVLNKEIKKQGNLYVSYKIVSGLNVYTDKFSLYFNTSENSERGCAAFFDLPKEAFLKNSCKEKKK